MKAILVDDESLLLAHMEERISQMGDIRLIGMYSNPYEALQAILRDRPDVVFLDIEMPEMNGLQLAEHIQNELPSVRIVFVTAYSEYAVKAFELNAVDYLLKPLKRDRLVRTIERLRGEQASGKTSVQSVRIHCFQTFYFTDDKARILDVRWRTNKAKELFLFLLQHRNLPVRKDIILELFWPETDWNKAFTLMYTTIYQIRKTLESISCPIKITSREDSYLLELNRVKLDVDEWEEEVKCLPAITRETSSHIRQILDLYKGDYLADLPYTWAEGERERLKNHWFSHMKGLVDHFIGIDEIHEAIALAHRIQELHPYREDSYFMLMKLYGALSDRQSIEVQYQKLVGMMAEQFGDVPDREVQMWYENWKHHHS